MRRLRAVATTEARSLEFLILAASRLQEARGARFDEIDGDVWTVPSARMKAKRPHRVPLSAAALAIVERQRQGKSGPFSSLPEPVASPSARAAYIACCLFWSAIVASCMDSARRFVTGWWRPRSSPAMGRRFRWRIASAKKKSAPTAAATCSISAVN